MSQIWQHSPSYSARHQKECSALTKPVHWKTNDNRVCEFHPIFITTFRNRVRPPTPRCDWNSVVDFFEGRRHSKVFRCDSPPILLQLRFLQVPLWLCVHPTGAAITHTNIAQNVASSHSHSTRVQDWSLNATTRVSGSPSWFFHPAPVSRNFFHRFCTRFSGTFPGILEDPWAGTGRSSTSERTDCVGVGPTTPWAGSVNTSASEKETLITGAHCCQGTCAARVHGQRERGVCAAWSSERSNATGVVLVWPRSDPPKGTHAGQKTNFCWWWVPTGLPELSLSKNISLSL